MLLVEAAVRVPLGAPEMAGKRVLVVPATFDPDVEVCARGCAAGGGGGGGGLLE